MRTLFALAAAAVCLTVAGPSFAASQTFVLSAADSAAGLGSGPFGQVTVTENAGSLNFTETLTAGD